MEASALYRLTFPNGKGYFGIANDFEKRMRGHRARAARGDSPCPVHKAIRHFGWENVKAEVILYGSREYVAEMERRAIAAYGTETWTGGGYNATLGGDRCDGPVARANQSASLRASGKARDVALRTWADPAVRAKRVAHAQSPEGRAARRGKLGKKETDETRRRKSAAMTGRKCSEEHCAAIGASKRGTIYITDGVRSRRIRPGDEIPTGWRRGFTRATRSI